MSCAQKKITQDQFPSAIDSNYHSVLFEKDEMKFFGHLIIKAPTSGPFSFKVFTIHKGTVSLKSSECGINTVQSYLNSSIVEFTLNPSKTRCLFSVLVMPDFTEKESGGVKWKSLSGLVLMKRDSNQFSGNSHLILSNDFSWFTLNIEDQAARVFYKGCGYGENKTYKQGSHPVFISPKEKDCVIEGFIKGQKQNETIMELVSVYDKDFMKLPFPQLSRLGKEFTIEASSQVSLIILNGVSYFKNTLNLENPSFPMEVRFYSSAGRAVYCSIFSYKEAVCLN